MSKQGQMPLLSSYISSEIARDGVGHNTRHFIDRCIMLLCPYFCDNESLVPELVLVFNVALRGALRGAELGFLDPDCTVASSTVAPRIVMVSVVSSGLALNSEGLAVELLVGFVSISVRNRSGNHRGNYL